MPQLILTRPGLCKSKRRPNTEVCILIIRSPVLGFSSASCRFSTYETVSIHSGHFLCGRISLVEIGFQISNLQNCGPPKLMITGIDSSGMSGRGPQQDRLDLFLGGYARHSFHWNLCGNHQLRWSTILKVGNLKTNLD